MTTTGCDLASLARDGRNHFDDVLTETQGTLGRFAQKVRDVIYAPANEVEARLIRIATDVETLVETLASQQRHAGNQFDDCFEEIRKQWHEAVNQRAEEMDNHEDCYSSETLNESVSEAISTLKRRIKDAVVREIDDAEAY